MSVGTSTIGRGHTPGPWIVAATLVAICGFYFWGTLPHLANSPPPDWAEMGIAAPAYKLASEGIYGNELFSGFFRSESYNYEYMPAYPLLVGLSFRLFGLGVMQARLVSVFCGLLIVLLTFELGRRLWGAATGLAAAGALVVVRLGLVPETSGIPLVDFAHVIRYDILVPVFVLLACLSLCHGWDQAAGSQGRVAGTPRSNQLAYGLAGFFCGLATLSHVYGTFLLAVFVLAVLWQEGFPALGRRSLYLILGGWVLALLPWIVYVGQEPASYLGQMSRHEGRFDLLDPWFYWDNLTREYGRYGAWSGASLGSAFFQPRVGIWLLVVGVPASTFRLWGQIRRWGRPGDRLLLLSLPVLGLLMGLLVHVKRYAYVALLLPFVALFIGLAVVSLWNWSQRFQWPGRVAVALVLALALVEGSAGVAASHSGAARTTPYRQVTDELVALLPPGSRLLISQPYWLGLAAYETRSVNLVLQLSRSSSIPEAMTAVDPDFVVIEGLFVDPLSRDPRSLPSEHRFYPWFRAFGSYLTRHCAEVSRTLAGADYGEILVYRCGNEEAYHKP